MQNGQRKTVWWEWLPTTGPAIGLIPNLRIAWLMDVRRYVGFRIMRQSWESIRQRLWFKALQREDMWRLGQQFLIP